MNWIKNSTFHTFVLHLTLLFNVCTLSVHAQENNPVIDKTGLLTIGTKNTEDTPISWVLDSTKLEELIENQEPPEDSTKPKTGLLGIKIEKNGTLEIVENTDVPLGGNYLSIEGALIINLDKDNGLHGLIENDEEGEPEPPQTISITLNGGLIDVNAVVAGDTEAELDAGITLGASGGTIDIADGLTYTIGTINLANGTAGDFIKEGNGNLIVDTVKVGGTFQIKAGDVHFSNDASVGKLMNSDSTTIISGQRSDDPATTDKVETNSSLTISKGGEIKGTLEDIGYLLVGDGSTASKLTLEENQEHTNIGRIGITKNTTLDLQAGSIQLAADPIETPEPEEEEGEESEEGEDEEGETKTVDYGNMIVEGTLKVSDTAGRIFKEGGETPTDFVVSLIGSTDSENKVVNGIIDIYKSDTTSTEPKTIDAHDMNIQVIGLGKISVAKDLTFQSGTVNFGTAGQSTVTGAHLFVDGGGTYKADEINLGAGYLLVQGEGTMVEVGGKLDAGVLSTEKGTSVIAQGDAAFTQVSIAGNYDAGGKNLTIDSGGQITGNISNIDVLKLGKGELLLQYNPGASESSTMSTLSDTSTSMITAQSLDIDDNTRIRMVGMGTDHYSDVFKIDDATSRDKLLESLNKVQTALYNGVWSYNEENKTIDVDLNVLSVKEYVSDSWGKGGSNAANAGLFLDHLGELYPTFAYTLAGLTPAQMQTTLREIQAGELTGNVLQMALRPPAQSVFRHLDTVMPLRSPFSRSSMRGQIREGYNVWFTPFGQSEQADGDGATFDGYDMTRFGFHLGGDIEIYNRAVLGALFSYTNPQVKSELGKVSANDYTAGLYFRMPTAWAVVANMMIGFGNQDYSYESFYGKSKFRGGSFFASAELTRPVSFQTFQLTPLIALDYQSAEMDDYVFNAAGVGYLLVQSGDISQTALRIGMLGSAGRFRARLQYIRQLAGDDYVLSRTTALGNLTDVATARSLEWGKDWINVGVGGELFAMRYWRIFADYNFDVGKHTTSHTGSLNSVLTW